MNHIIIKTVFIASLVISGFACSSSGSQGVAGNEASEGLIHITKQQFESEKMKLGQPRQVLFQSGISCNGYINAQPDGVAQINTILPGRVEAIYAVLGQQVKKGQHIALLSSSQLIDLQQQYLKALALKKKQTADYERAKELYESKIGSEKEFLFIESEYNLVVADYNALRLQLKRLQLDVEAIGKGTIVDTYPLISPIEGELTQLNVVLGDYVELEEDVAEVVNTKRLQLSLSVFEQDVPQLKTGSPVLFRLLNDEQSSYSAELVSIAKRVQDDSRAIECRASIDAHDGQPFVYKAFVQAQVITKQHEGLGLPEDALVKQGDDIYYLVVGEQDDQGYSLTMKKAETGKRFNGYVEVMNASADEQVVIAGVYNLSVEELK